MSGIYIPMEMPKSCPCELVGIGYDLCCSFAGGIPARVKEYYECCQNDTRPSWCPLVPVPEHGRLIDADALENELKSRLEKEGDGWMASEINMAQRAMRVSDYKIVKSAPTIIPASGKEGE